MVIVSAVREFDGGGVAVDISLDSSPRDCVMKPWTFSEFTTCYQIKYLVSQLVYIYLCCFIGDLGNTILCLVDGILGY